MRSALGYDLERGPLMASEFLTARDNLAAFLALVPYTPPTGVPGVGLPNVKLRQLFMLEPQEIRAQIAEGVPPFGTRDHRIHTWQISRRAVRGLRAGDYRERLHEIELRGYLAFSKADLAYSGALVDTETEFQELIDLVLDETEKHVHFGGEGGNAATDLTHGQQPIVEQVDFVEYVGVLCHHVTILYDVNAIKVLNAED